MSRAHLLVLGEREGIVWVLREQRMAFRSKRAGVAELAKGDRLFLYTTRGAWGNPPRDRGRVIGWATATSAVTAIDEIEIGGRLFGLACNLRIEGLAPCCTGPELSSLVTVLDTFPRP